MAKLNEKVFLHFWPKCFIAFMGVIGLIVVILLFITELGNIAANFWTANVFAGGWCGIVLLIHSILVLLSGCCSPGTKSAYRAVIVSVIGLVATAALISFDATFVARPSMCILTPSCVENSASNTTFSYSFRESFFTVFNSWGPFKSYKESHVKFLCQTIQLGVGGLAFILCLLYLIIYYVTANKAKPQVAPDPTVQRQLQQQQHQPFYPSPPPPMAAQGYYPPPPPPPPGPPGYYPQYYQPPAPVWRPPAPPQGPYNAMPWN